MPNLAQRKEDCFFLFRKEKLSLRKFLKIQMAKKYLYAPGCALMIYKPHLANTLKKVAEEMFGKMDTLLECCFTRPQIEAGTCILTPCTTCHSHYKKLYPDCEVKLLLAEIAQKDEFPFPDYHGMEMSIQDTCSGRTDDLYLVTIRSLLKRMNIEIVEAEKSGRRGKCCGQVFYGKLPLEKVEHQMKLRAEEMPRRDVVVYCASCIQGMSLGGRHPHYILDLLFGETTTAHDKGVVSWNNTLKDFREKNSSAKNA